MESIISYFSEIDIDIWIFLKFSGILLLGSLLLSSVSRFIFKKKTLFSCSITSSIAIIFIYVAMVLILTVVTDLRFLAAPCPLLPSPKIASVFSVLQMRPIQLLQENC